MNKILILVVMMSFLGCTYTTSSYYYISLENTPSANIKSRGKITLKDLQGGKEIPISYVIDRKLYTLNLFIGNQSYFPHFSILVKGSQGENLSLKPRRNIDVVSEKGTICSSFYQTEELSQLSFGWSPSCISQKIPKYISFDILDSHGNHLAKEDIPFEIKKNGTYRLIDSI